MKKVKINTLNVGDWFMHDKKWFRIKYIGTKNIKVGQVSSFKEYTLQSDIIVEI